MAKQGVKKESKRQKSFPPMNVEGVKTYCCGEPDGDQNMPPEAIANLMIKHGGKHARIHPGGAYPNLPGDLANALLKDGAVKEM